MRISTGIGVRRRCRKRMLISLTGTRTAKHTKEMSNSAILVWGRFSNTDAKVWKYRSVSGREINTNCHAFVFNAICSNMLNLPSSSHHEALHTLKREKVPVWRGSRSPSMLCSCEMVTWKAAALVKALTIGSDRYVERKPSWSPNIQSWSTRDQQHYHLFCGFIFSTLDSAISAAFIIYFCDFLINP